MDTDNESDELLTPTEIQDMTNLVSIGLLPERSKRKYAYAYKIFVKWQKEKNIDSFDESVLLMYFDELSVKYKLSSLLTQCSILGKMLKIHHGVKIYKYQKLQEFLRRKAKGYKAISTKTFTSDEIKAFIDQAPDKEYLATKVCLVCVKLFQWRNYKNKTSIPN